MDIADDFILFHCPCIHTGRYHNSICGTRNKGTYFSTVFNGKCSFITPLDDIPLKDELFVLIAQARAIAERGGVNLMNYYQSTKLSLRLNGVCNRVYVISTL